MITLVVADDQTAIREALAAMLDLAPDVQVVARAANGREAVDAVEQHRPDVLLTDLRMPVLDGAGATAEVVQRFPATAVVLLTTFDDEESILTALQAGARGYLTKEAGREEILTAVRAAAGGQSVLDPAVQARLVAAATSTPSPTGDAAALAQLTTREREVLDLIARGLANRQIARELVVSEATVKTHINNLFAKLHLRDRAHAMRFAIDHGLG